MAPKKIKQIKEIKLQEISKQLVELKLEESTATAIGSVSKSYNLTIEFIKKEIILDKNYSTNFKKNKKKDRYYECRNNWLISSCCK